MGAGNVPAGPLGRMGGGGGASRVAKALLFGFIGACCFR